MKLSVTAWEFSSKIINEIKSHAFNQQLMKGTLDLNKFAYYIEQDYIYLQDFARCLAIIAAKISPNYAKNFYVIPNLLIKSRKWCINFSNKFLIFKKLN